MTAQVTGEAPATTFSELFNAIAANIEIVIQGKPEVVELALVCLLAEGHLLIEDVPGRRQDEPGQGPGGLDRLHRGSGCSSPPTCCRPTSSGVTRLEPGPRHRFEFRPGPVFANIVLGDEINRASPKTQSAAARGHGGAPGHRRRHHLPARPSPFMVIATQNPIEHEGTYPLPESQLDRFLMRLSVGYPEPPVRAGDPRHPRRRQARCPRSTRWPPPPRSRRWSTAVKTIHVAPALKGYLVDLADATRRHPNVALGMSPRATLALQRAARARAAAAGPHLRHPRRHQGARRPGAGPPPRAVVRRPAAGHQRRQGRGRRAGRGAGPDGEVGVLTRQGWVAAGRRRRRCWSRPALFGIIELYVAGAALVLLPLAALIYVRAARVRLRVRRSLSPTRVHAGDATRVELRRHQPRQPPHAGAAPPRPGRRHPWRPAPPGPAAPGRVGAGRLPAAHRRRRGIIAVGPLGVGGRRSLRPGRPAPPRRAPVLELTVYPHVDRIAAPPRRRRPRPPRRRRQPERARPQGDDFYALREYVVGDDLRRVHWPSTARRDELMVRHDEMPWQDRTTVVLDVRRASHTAASLERAVSAAASVDHRRRPASSTSPASWPATASTPASGPASPTSRRSWSTWPASTWSGTAPCARSSTR